MTSLQGAPRLIDVAQASGVSLATASRVLNGSARTVSGDLRSRVLATADELGYIPHAQAQAVARGQSDVVTVVVGDIADPYFASVTAGVAAEADRAGLTVSIASIGADRRRAATIAGLLRAQRPRAVIVAVSPGVPDPLQASLKDLPARGTSVAILSPSPDLPIEPGTRALRIANRAGAQALGSQLRALGYRRFAVLTSDGLLTARERAEGFAAGVGRGATVRTISGPLTRDGGFALAHRCLEWDPLPDCIFAVTDLMAVGAMTALRGGGLRPGIDIGVAGFDDVTLLRDIEPRLSSVGLPLEEMGARALRLALGGLPAAVVSGEVQLRASTPGLRR